MPGYTFKHALVQDTAYSTLLRSRRQQLHARIAATLEDRFPEIVLAQPAPSSANDRFLGNPRSLVWPGMSLDDPNALRVPLRSG
jgi:hypothetical protein